MKFLVPFALIASTAAQCASIEGRVFDPSTAVVPNAQVQLWRGGHQQEARKTGDDGTFGFDSLVAGVYEVKVLAPGFQIFERRGIKLTENASAQVNALLRLGEIQETVEVRGQGQAKPQPRTPTRVRVGGNLVPTKLLQSPKPAYPEAARAEGREGTVVLRAVISVEGNLLSVTALPGSDPVLATAATDAVKQWKYQPTLLNGKPVEIVTTVEVRFKLE